jgi:hypothetical protein
VDALELMVDQRHLDQGIGFDTRSSVDEALQVTHQLKHNVRILRREVDGFSSGVLQRSSGQLSKSGAILLQLALDSQNVVESEEPVLRHETKSDA